MISATFSADPVLDALDFWAARLGAPLHPRLAPYAQVHQQLLDPASDLRAAAAAVLCIRWSDLAGAAGDTGAAQEELARAIKGANLAGPLLVVLCPGAGDSASRESEAFKTRIDDGQTVIIDLADAFARYECHAPLDLAADRLGHVPYTDEAFAVLGTVIARWRLAAIRAPIKLVAADCDNTLWGGVVGEDGVRGVKIEKGHADLQRRLAAQGAAGRIVCLLSKNNDADVRAVFDARSDMAITWNDIAARRINWAPKAENMSALMEAFNISLDSALFLDDSGVECAEMRALAPAVATVRTPTDAAELARFVDHLWLLDVVPGTAEDARRAEMYREAAARDEARSEVSSLAEFIASLDLKIEIEPATQETLPRLAQLTQRTNQFNVSLLRLNETDLRASLDAASEEFCSVRVKDRFGDYGVVGQFRARAESDALFVDLMTLSCRALGRGVEHEMLKSIAKAALARGLARVRIAFVKGARNDPAARFLETAFGVEGGLSQDAVLEADAAALTALEFAPDAEETSSRDESHPAILEAREPSPQGAGAEIGMRYEEIARSLTTGAAIRAAMTADVKARPDLAEGYAAPAAGLERDIARIWERVLRVTPIGAHDRFQDLGGKSIDLVRIHGALRAEMGADLDLAAFFQFSTVAKLAKRLADGEETSNPAAARAAKMRAARERFAARQPVFAEARR